MGKATGQRPLDTGLRLADARWGKMMSRGYLFLSAEVGLTCESPGKRRVVLMA